MLEGLLVLLLEVELMLEGLLVELELVDELDRLDGLLVLEGLLGLLNDVDDRLLGELELVDELDRLLSELDDWEELLVELRLDRLDLLLKLELLWLLVELDELL